MNNVSSSEEPTKIPTKYSSSTLDKLTFLLQNVADQLIHLVISYNGHINLNLLKKAIRLSLNIEPILGCKFVDHPNKPYWERRDDFDQINYCSLVESGNIEKDLEEFVLQEEIDPTKEPLFHFRIFRSETDTLCFKVNHVIMDGAGIQDYLSLIISIYTSLEKNQPIKMKPNVSGSRGFNQVLRKFGFFKKFFLFLKNRAPKPSWCFPWSGTKKTKKNYLIHRYFPERFRRIKQYGKERGATINDMLLTAFYRAMFKIAKPKPGEPMVSVVTVNLRSYLKNYQAESICNLSTGVYPNIAYNPADSFDDTLKIVRKAMNKIKRNYPGIGPAFSLKQVFRLKFSKVKKNILRRINTDLKTRKTHPVLTNVGLIASDSLDFGEIKAKDAYLITPIVHAPGFIMGIITFKEKMTLSIGFCEGSYEKEVIEEFLELIDKELPS